MTESAVRRTRPGARASTVSIRRLSKTALVRGAVLYPERGYWKPRTRGDCEDMERPCPYVSCRYHLALDVDPVRGSIKSNFPGLEVDEMAETCALDVAERGGVILDVIGEVMNLTRERVRQVEESGLVALRAKSARLRAAALERTPEQAHLETIVLAAVDEAEQAIVEEA